MLLPGAGPGFLHGQLYLIREFKDLRGLSLAFLCIFAGNRESKRVFPQLDLQIGGMRDFVLLIGGVVGKYSFVSGITLGRRVVFISLKLTDSV